MNSAARRDLPIPASPASRTRRRSSPTAASHASCRAPSASSRPTNACRAVAAFSAVGSGPGAKPAAAGTWAGGASPRSSRAWSAITAGPGVVPSSSRSIWRSSSNARSASAGLPDASWTSISSRWADSRNGASPIAVRAACSAASSSRPPIRSPASPSASSARRRSPSTSRRRSRTHGPSHSARNGSAPSASAARAWAAASSQRRSSSAWTATSTASASASVSTHSGSGNASRSSARPASASGPSARRSFDSSEESAESDDAGASFGHSTSSSS